MFAFHHQRSGARSLDALSLEQAFPRDCIGDAVAVIDRLQLLQLTDLWQALDALQDWISRLTSRPAYQRALPKQRMLDVFERRLDHGRD